MADLADAAAEHVRRGPDDRRRRLRGRAPSARATHVVALAIGVVVMETLAIVYDPNDVFFPVTFFWIMPWVVGRTIRNQTMLARELAEKAERAQHAREEEERRAIAVERSRIARELHDVLAHNLSVMVVQAAPRGGCSTSDPERAVEAAALIERDRPRGAGRDPPPVRRRCAAARRRAAPGAHEHRARGRAGAPRPRAPGCGVELRGRGRRRSSCPPASTWPRTGSCRRRSPTCSSTPGARAHAVTVALRAERGRAERRGRRRGPRDGYELGEAGGGHGLRGHARAGRACTAASSQAGPAPDGGFAVRAPAAHAAAGAGMSIRGAARGRPGAGPGRLPHDPRRRGGHRGGGRGADGTQAVDRSRGCTPDVVLMDIRMPEMDGIEATRLIAGATATPAARAHAHHLRPRRVRVRRAARRARAASC